MSLLERLANPNELSAMPLNEKLVASLSVAILGMGITFIVLIFLQYCIKLMSRLVGGTAEHKQVTVTESSVSLEKPRPVDAPPVEEDEEELIAVLTAAVAACMGRPADRFVLRNVRQLPDAAPGWARAGLSDQMTLRRTH